VFLSALHQAGYYLGEFQSRSLTTALRLIGDEARWQEITNMHFDADRFRAAAEEDFARSNDLCYCSFGALLALQHMGAFELLDGYQQPQLVRKLRRIRDWCFSFDNPVAEDRFLTLIRLIEEKCNQEASGFLHVPSKNLSTLAQNRMKYWRDGAALQVSRSA
jgi:hypothetical protein